MSNYRCDCMSVSAFYAVDADDATANTCKKRVKLTVYVQNAVDADDSTAKTSKSPSKIQPFLYIKACVSAFYAVESSANTCETE